MHKAIRNLLVLACVVMLTATAALAWAPGTHAYIASHMKDVENVNPSDLMYGAIAPDINQVLSTDQNSPFFWATHYGFMSLWDAATPEQRALAFGYVTHNEAWGADHFAHIQSHVYPNYVNPFPAYAGQNGYVWKKAGDLCAALQADFGSNPVAAAMLQGPKGLMNCHFIVEYGMDLVLKRLRDPQIGAKLVMAATQHNSGEMVALFTTGYPRIAPAFTTPIQELGYATAPQAWAYTMYQYGSALSQPAETGEDVVAVSDFLVGLAAQMLKDDLQAAGVDASALKPLIYYGLLESMVVTAGDYPNELTATIGEVRGKLASHDVRLPKY